MKYRTFFTTLVLFLFTFNLGILIVSISMFKDTVHNAEERSLGEHYFITSALVKDFNALESRGIDLSDSIGDLFRPYHFLSGNKKVQLLLYEHEQLVYFNRQPIALQRDILKPLENENRFISMEKLDEHTYVIVSGKLPNPYHNYAMVYIYDITDALASWSKTKNTLFLVGFVLSCVLALGLLLLLNRIFKPLSQISNTSRDIATGAYETRLPIYGNDEISNMARSFNFMAEEIERQVTELTVAAEKKQQFIDNFAHELRTPLTAIYGYAEYLQKAALTEEDRLSAVNYIMSESGRLQALGNQLLDLANLKNDQLTWEKLNVPNLFRFVRQTLQAKMAERNIKFRFQTEIEIIDGDAHLLKSLFINLVDNAIKACGPGGEITIDATKEAQTKHQIITIRDNGKGMTPEILQHITEPFYRAENSRSRVEGGAGLGLAICKQIALVHRAKLDFESQPSKGTTVKVTFTTS